MDGREENFLTHFEEVITIDETSQAKCLEFTPNGELLSYVVNDSLKILSSKNFQLKNNITAPMDTMCYFQNNTLLHSKDNSLLYLSIYDNKYLRSFEGHKDKIHSISVNTNNDTFMSIDNEAIKIWDIRYKDPILSINSKGKIGAINRDNDFAVADNNFIYIYDIKNSAHPLVSKAIKPQFYKKMFYTADSSCICLTTLKTHTFYEHNGELLTSINLENESDGCCIDDSNIFLCGSGKNILAYKIQDKKKIGRSCTEKLDVSVIRSNPAESQLIFGSGTTFKVLNRKKNDRRAQDETRNG